MKTVSFLVNPYSGGQQGRALIKKLNALLTSGQIDGRIIELDLSKFEAQVIEAANSDLIMIAGGDGTIHNLLPYLLTAKRPVGIIPLGTGNDLARELNLKLSYSWSSLPNFLKRSLRAEAKPLSIWKLSYGEDFSKSTLFCNYFSIGFDAAVVRDFALSRSSSGSYIPALGRWGNRIGYLSAAIKNLTKVRSFSGVKCCADQKVCEPLSASIALFFANIHCVAGLGISEPSSDSSDSKIELIQIDSVWNYVSMLLFHKAPLPRPRLISSAESWELTQVPAELIVQLDGEAVNTISSSQYRIELGGSIQMITFD